MMIIGLEAPNDDREPCRIVKLKNIILGPWLLLAHMRCYFLAGQDREIGFQTQPPGLSCYRFDNYLTRAIEVPGPSDDGKTASLNVRALVDSRHRACEEAAVYPPRYQGIIWHIGCLALLYLYDFLSTGGCCVGSVC